uniref:Uncharacterized protein n=1 Tax=Trypanosoma congolense (strain IL3000) TaxID=1068625 RepID=G0UR65_TRYCI|nr:hypothetical protein, unlikely [Trypanosoma congolense IL3000]
MENMCMVYTHISTHIVVNISASLAERYVNGNGEKEIKLRLRQRDVREAIPAANILTRGMPQWKGKEKDDNNVLCLYSFFLFFVCMDPLRFPHTLRHAKRQTLSFMTPSQCLTRASRVKSYSS